MILMAIDHTRDFFGIPGQNPTNLATASAGLFLTRWITHFCAPVFFLLTGTGAFLSLRRRSPPELSRFLVTRGLWLLFVETVLLRCLGYQFNVDFRVTMLLVLWALGWSMIVLAGLVRFPPWVACAFGIVLVAGHNLLDGVKSANPLWAILHGPGFVLNTPSHVVFAAYPLIPWVGVTALGYALGQVYRWEADRRRRLLLRAGVALTVAFFVVRGLNVYGDPAPVGAAADGSLHPAVVPQRHQVPAVAVVPAHDARASPAHASRRGRARPARCFGPRSCSAGCRCSTICCTSR